MVKKFNNQRKGMKTFLITGGRAPACLEMARLLFKGENRIIIADSLKHHLCELSKTIAICYYVSSPRMTTLKYINELVEIIKKEKVDVLIPTYEETFYIAAHKKTLSKYCSVFVDDITKISILHNKNTFIKKVQQLGFKVPNTYEVTSSDEAIKLFKKNPKVVLKPSFSRFGDDVIILPKSISVIKKIQITHKQPYIVQDFIKGEQFCSYSICQNGQIKANSIYPVQITANKVCITFSAIRNQKIESWIKKFIADLNFSGQIAFDFIKDEKGNIYPIECNPRITSGIHLFTDCDQFHNLFMDHSIKNTILYPKESIKVMIAILALMYSFKNIKTLFRNLKIFLGCKDIIFSIKDPLPMFGQFFVSLYYIFQGFKRKISFREITMSDIVWNGEAI